MKIASVLMGCTRRVRPMRAILTCKAATHQGRRSRVLYPLSFCNWSWPYIGRRSRAPRRLDTVCPRCQYRHRYTLRGGPQGNRSTLSLEDADDDRSIDELVDRCKGLNAAAMLAHGFVKASLLKRNGTLYDYDNPRPRGRSGDHLPGRRPGP